MLFVVIWKPTSDAIQLWIISAKPHSEWYFRCFWLLLDSEQFIDSKNFSSLKFVSPPTTGGHITAWFTYENDFDSPDNVHGRGQSYTSVEEHPDGSSTLRTQWSGYQEVWPTSRNHSIRGYGTHRDGCQHRLKHKTMDISGIISG